MTIKLGPICIEIDGELVIVLSLFVTLCFIVVCLVYMVKK